MSYAIFSKSNAFPVAIAGSKLVKAFPSGLLLVSQEYAVPRGQEDTYAATFAVGQPLTVDSPAIDGLYIFPEPEWRDSGDGFTRLSVSAYGRWLSAGQKTYSKVLGNIRVTWNVTPDYDILSTAAFSSTIPTINDQLIWNFVSLKSAAPNVTVSDTLKAYRATGTNASPFTVSQFFDTTGHNTAAPGIPMPTTVAFTAEKILTRAENTNFGAWDEWTVVWQATPPESVSLGWFYEILPPIPGHRQYDLPVNSPPGSVANTASISLLGINNEGYHEGHAHTLTVTKMENLQTDGQGFAPNTPRTNIVAATSTATHLGGSVVWNGKFLNYTAPSVAKPNALTPGNTYTNNGFTWDKIVTPDWSIETRYETFVFEVKNELDQTGSGYVQIRITDPLYPAAD